MSRATTQSPSHSGHFRLERDMFESLGLFLPARITESGRLVQLREPTIGSVIPDLLFGEWTDDLRAPKISFTWIEAQILSLLEEHDELFASDVLKLLHLSARAATRALKRIQASGLLITTRDGKVSLDVGSFTRGMTITAIELKLSRWREALDQALTYLRFADRSYVVLDADRASPNEEMLNAFQASGVGLLALGSSDLNELVPARALRCVSAQRVLAAQKLCASIAGSGPLDSSVSTPSLECI